MRKDETLSVMRVDAVSTRAMRAGGRASIGTIGASRAMPPIIGLNTSMKATLAELMMSACCAVVLALCVK